MELFEKRREHFFDAALRRVSDLVIITNADFESPTGPKIVYVNEALTQLTGYQPHEVIGQSPKSFKAQRQTERLLIE